MKKLTGLFAALLLVQFAWAQKGLEAGLNFVPGNTWIINDEDFAEGPEQDFRATFGYNAGLTLGYNLTDGFGITSGVLLSRQGQRYTTGYENRSKSEQDFSSRELNYIRIPILLKVNGDLGGSATSFVRFGPHLDFLTGATYKYDTNLGILGRRTGQENLRNYQPLGASEPYKIYKSMVLGATLELGSRIKITDNLGVILALNLSGSFNVEDVDARKKFPSTGQTITNIWGDRSNTFNVMGGLTVGVNYVVSFD